MTNPQITARLANLIQSGMDVRAAWETVFGPGSWSTMAGHVYDALRAKGGAA